MENWIQLQFLVLEMRPMPIVFSNPLLTHERRWGFSLLLLPLTVVTEMPMPTSLTAQPLPGSSGLHFPEQLAGGEACFKILCFSLCLPWCLPQLMSVTQLYWLNYRECWAHSSLLCKPVCLASERRRGRLLFPPVFQYWPLHVPSWEMLCF